MRSELLRFDDWTKPVAAFDREVVSVPADGEPVLFVPGPGHGAWAFAEHWLARTAARGFAAHALTPRPGGDLRAHVHDVVQVAASLPRQTVLVGHGVGALVVARALGRYPARAAVLVAPVLDRWATLGAALRANPGGTLPGLVGGRVRLNRRQLFSPSLPLDEASRLIALVSPEKPINPGKNYSVRVGNPPTLVVGSPDDRVVPRTSLDRTAARYGGAPLLFPGMGHDLMLDTGWEEPIDAILDWLAKELASGG